LTRNVLNWGIGFAVALENSLDFIWMLWFYFLSFLTGIKAFQVHSHLFHHFLHRTIFIVSQRNKRVIK
jgi:hypothetical protein